MATQRARERSAVIRATLWHLLRLGGRLTGGGVHQSPLERMRLRGLGVLDVLGVVLVLADDRAGPAQPVHRDGAVPEHLRDAPGQIEDGRRDVVSTWPGVQV